jgi:hypothetical protein
LVDSLPKLLAFPLVFLVSSDSLHQSDFNDFITNPENFGWNELVLADPIKLLAAVDSSVFWNPCELSSVDCWLLLHPDVVELEDSFSLALDGDSEVDEEELKKEVS